MDEIDELFEGVYQSGRWPVTIYPGWLRISLTFLVPIAFAVTVPAQALTSRLTPETLALAAAFAIGLMLFTRWWFASGGWTDQPERAERRDVDREDAAGGEHREETERKERSPGPFDDGMPGVIGEARRDGRKHAERKPMAARTGGRRRQELIDKRRQPMDRSPDRR